LGDSIRAGIFAATDLDQSSLERGLQPIRHPGVPALPAPHVRSREPALRADGPLREVDPLGGPPADLVVPLRQLQRRPLRRVGYDHFTTLFCSQNTFN
jgi:hypothetical protein